MKRVFSLALVQLRISASSAMAYRADFFIEGGMSLVWMGLTLLPLVVLYQNGGVVAGWRAEEALVIIGYFMLVRAVLEGVVSPSLVELVERIRSGAFDYTLLKPVDAQVLISTSKFEPWKIFDVLGAVGLLVYAFYRRGYPPAPLDLVLGIALLFAGIAAMYAMWIACAAASFWVVRLDNLTYLLGAVFDVARWPIQVFHGAWRFIFTFIIPVALMTSYPAMALLGRLEPAYAAGVAGGAIALLIASRLLWRVAIRNYTSASS